MGWVITTLLLLDTCLLDMAKLRGFRRGVKGRELALAMAGADSALGQGGIQGANGFGEVQDLRYRHSMAECLERRSEERRVGKECRN